MSHISLTYHIVFSTYKRGHTIDIAHERELYKFIYDLATSKGAFVRRIGGMPDHIHILTDIPPTLPVADFVRNIKTESSKFMRVNPHFCNWAGWGAGYGAFSADASSRNAICAYIRNQKAHHRIHSFDEEYTVLSQ